MSLALLQAAGDARAFPMMPPEGSRWAPEVDHLFLALVAFAVVISVALCAAIVTFAVRYRRTVDVDRGGPTRRSSVYEVAWILVASVISMGFFWWGATGYIDMHVPPSDAYTVYVMGKQWMWKVLHPSGRQEIDALHVPAGQAVRVLLVSQDVIHSFFVPAFRVKQDALPDRYTSVWFDAEAPGTYDLFCAEYCGLGHSRMIGKVVVMAPDDFQRWLGAESQVAPASGTPGTPEAPLAVAGQGPLQRNGCIACHVPDAAVRAPRLDGLYLSQVRLRNGSVVVADEQYLRESILRPNAKITAGYQQPSLMPAYEGQLDETEVARLVEAIKAMRYGWKEEDR